jgi:hypothetical protein
VAHPTGDLGTLASVDASERDRLAARPLALQRSRLFDQQAEAYDRFRPTYPDAVIDELLGPVPAGLDVLESRAARRSPSAPGVRGLPVIRREDRTRLGDRRHLSGARLAICCVSFG